MTEDQAVATLKSVNGDERHPYLLVVDGKTWGDKGGKQYDDYLRVIEKLKIDKGLTEDQVIEELETVKGDEWHPYLLLVDKRDKGGKQYDEYHRVIEKLKINNRLT